MLTLSRSKAFELALGFGGVGEGCAIDGARAVREHRGQLIGVGGELFKIAAGKSHAFNASIPGFAQCRTADLPVGSENGDAHIDS